MREINHLVKPFLKWAGGKRQLADQIVPIIPSSPKTYYEPFIGAGAILFAKQPQNAVINDLNTQLCLTYEVIRDNVEELIEILQQHKESNETIGADYFYKIREVDRDTKAFNNLSKVEKSARMIYLNKTCYNGLYRVNSQGLFNTPYGRYKNPAICEAEVLRAIHNYFESSNITILNGDFAAAVCDAKKGDFVYFDPPYDSPNCTNFTGYQADGFDHTEQLRLRDLMIDLTERGVKCLLSNASTDFISEIYSKEVCSKFETKTVKASRNINSNGDGRGKVDEVLVRNW